MTSLKVIRKFGERRPVQLRVTYPDSYDLSAAAVYFWLDDPDGTPKVERADAEATDITPDTAVAQTVWLLSYTFDEDDLAELGAHGGEFEIDFGGGFSEFYPIGKDKLVVTVVEHPASTA